jgi:sarcosine oxidase subunit beta
MSKKIFTPDTGNLPNSADVVVIGGGIVGVATAFWLSRAGLNTVLLEMRDGLSTLTTTQSIESFRTQFTEPAMAEIALPSISMYENFAETTGLEDYDIALKHQGYLFVSDDDSMTDKLHAAVDTHHRLGAKESEFLTNEDIRKRFPYINPDMVAGTFCQRDGWLSSHEATQGFAKASSAQYLLGTKVIGIQQDEQGVCAVETNWGSIATRQVVNAAGPFAVQVAAMVGVDLPIEAIRRQKIHINPQPEIPTDAPLCIDIGSEVYWRPEHGGALAAWVDEDEPVTADPQEDVETDWDYPALLLDKLPKLSPFWNEVIPKLGARDIQTSAGYYMYTPDSQPLLGPVEQVPGFHLNCGYWAGVMLSPAAGKRVADLVVGEMANQDNPLRLSRYEEGLVTEGDSFLRGRK